MFLSIIIPAFNEEKNLEKGVLNEVYKFLRVQKYPWEVLVVDDGSSDGTAKMVDKFAKTHKGFLLLREPHRGKGGTIIAGTLKAKGDIVLFTDMDQATPLEEVEKFLPKLKEGYDIVIASRNGREGAPVLRKIMAYGFMVLRAIVLRLPFKDTQCGFKAFKREAAREIFSRLKVYGEKKIAFGASVTAGFDLEILYIARKLKLKVAEVGVNWHHRDTKRINPIKDSWEGFWDLINVRINAIMGKYQV